MDTIQNEKKDKGSDCTDKSQTNGYWGLDLAVRLVFGWMVGKEDKLFLVLKKREVDKVQLI